ncbi:MAG: CBS domain-containing protein [Thaumarchaeota archaeon]|nr:CBS domain-containing protein [Nitrososphaerota archaeon]
MVLFAKDVAEPAFLSLPRTTNALDAAKIMKEKHQGFVIVSDGVVPEGIVTEWDYLSKVIAEGKDASQVSIGEIMTTGLITVKGSEGLESVAKIMTERGVRRVLVLHDDKILGVITSRTILANLGEYVDQVSTTIARLQAPPS